MCERRSSGMVEPWIVHGRMRPYEQGWGCLSRAVEGVERVGLRQCLYEVS
jgi:hypothetical protein